MLALTAFLTMMLAWCTDSVLEDTETPAAKAFQQAVANNEYGPFIPATVQQSGYAYVGTCEGLKREDAGHGDTFCDATQAVNNLCRDLLSDEFPDPSPGGDSSRRLSVPEAFEADQRRLHGGHGGGGGVHGDAATAHVCFNSYVPWAKVQFQAWNGLGAVQTFTRCSYRMGTRHNSHVLAFNETLAEVARLSAFQNTPGAQLQIWNVTGRESVRCVVGYASMDELANFAETSGSPLPGVRALMMFFGAISACSALACVYDVLCKEDKGDQDEDGEGKIASKSEEEYETLNDEM